MVKVSIFVPCYNYGHYISETIDSILNQTYQDYEVIIVDDASDDGTTPAVIAKQAKRDKRIKVVTHAKNKGLPSARNTGIKNAKGNYILPLDADDKIDPTHLEKSVALIEKENADLVYTHLQCFGEKNKIAYFSSSQEWIKKTLPFKDCLAVCSLYKKSCWEEFGGYNENMKGYDDWDYWLYFAEHDKKLVLLNEALFFYRVHEGSMVSRSNRMRGKLIKTIKKNHPNLYKWNNYYCSFNYFKYVVRPALFQFRTRKGRKLFRVLGITFYKDK